MKRLRNLPLRIWAIVPVALLFSAAIVRLAWMIPYSVATVSKVVLVLAMAVTVGGLIFVINLLAKPGSRKLKSQPVRIGITAVATAGLICLTIHTIRFLPSPEAAALFSKVLAILLLAALASAYPLLLRFVWSAWATREKN